MLASNTDAASRPHGVRAGAGAAVLAHVPRRPGRLHCSSGPVQAVSQQTPSTQKVDEHCTRSVQLDPLGCGVGVAVGVGVDVLVAVCVGVAVGVAGTSASWPRISPPGNTASWMSM